MKRSSAEEGVAGESEQRGVRLEGSRLQLLPERMKAVCVRVCACSAAMLRAGLITGGNLTKNLLPLCLASLDKSPE